jgi:hypothetical protein
VCASCAAYDAELGAFSRMLRTAPLEQPEFAIFVPRRRLAARIQVGAAAAAVAATVVFAALSGALNGRDLHFLNASSAPRPAYLDSASYEQRLIREARAAHERESHPGSAVAT